MDPEDLKRLREELACSIGELAQTLGVDPKAILEWEAGERFPTKRHATRLEALQKAGPGAIVRKAKRAKAPSGIELLGDPRLWTIVRKLLAHPEFFGEVERLGEKYEEPG
jgi:transcriptional regulator with XRE-family HTH domain